MTQQQQSGKVLGYMDFSTGKFLSLAELAEAKAKAAKAKAKAERKPRGPSKAQIARVEAQLANHPAVQFVEWRAEWAVPEFWIVYRYPYVSTRTGNCFDAEETVAGALAAVQEVESDPDANAEWEDDEEAQA